MEQAIIQCTGQKCKIITPIPEDIHQEIFNSCSERDPSYFKQPKHIRNRTPWDGWFRLYPWNSRLFRVGLVDRISRILYSHGYSTNVMYDHKKSTSDLIRLSHIPFGDREYQHECAKYMINNPISMASIATGGGKTYISSLVTRDISMNTVFVVRSKDLMLQAYNDYKTYFPDADIKMVGDGNVEFGDITIVMVQSLMTLIESKAKKKKRKERGQKLVAIADQDREEQERIKAEKRRKSAQTRARKKDKLREEIVKRAKLVHIDECHMLGAETVFKIVGLFENAINICGWSATPRRQDGRNIHLEAGAGPIVYQKSMKQLIADGFLVPPTVRYVHIPARLERGKLGDGLVTVNRKYYDAMEYSTLLDWQVHDNIHRHEITAEWADYFKSKNKSHLIAVRRLEHGQILESLIPGSHFVHGQHNDRVELMKEFKMGGYKTMISTLCKEGFDAPIIEGIIIAIDTQDPEQMIGRGVRLNTGKTGCDVIHLVDDHKIFHNQIKSCREINNENEIVQIG